MAGNEPIKPITVRRNSESIQKFYSNNVEVRVSPWDFRLTFGEVAEVTAKELKIDNKAIIHMSPQHAKSMLRLLIRNIALYEKEFGAIPEIEVQSLQDDSESSK